MDRTVAVGSMTTDSVQLLPPLTAGAVHLHPTLLIITVKDKEPQVPQRTANSHATLQEGSKIWTMITGFCAHRSR